MGSQAIVKRFEGGEVWRLLFWSGSTLVFLTLVEVSCQISDTSDSSSESEWVSSSSARRDLKEALAHACLAAELRVLHWVTQWDLKILSSFPEFLHMSQKQEQGGVALDLERRFLPLEEACNELNLLIRTGSDSSSLLLWTSRSSVSIFSTMRGWISAQEGVVSLNHWVLFSFMYFGSLGSMLLSHWMTMNDSLKGVRASLVSNWDQW